MMFFYILKLLLYPPRVEWWSIWLFPSHLGLLLFVYCLFALYFRRARTKGLITTGPFKYTRHPMYTGLVLMDLAFWLPMPASTRPEFFGLQALFTICLLSAAWFQEKETLARFGKKADEYYSKTPRVILFYPFVDKCLF